MMNFAFDPTPLPEFYKDFQNTMALVAQVGGGEFIPFNEGTRLMRQIFILTLGSRWPVETEAYLRKSESE